MSPGNSLILGQNVKGETRESQNHCRRGSLHSCECWLLLVKPVRLEPLYHKSGLASGARFTKYLMINLGKLRIKCDFGKSLDKLRITYARVKINLIKMHFLRNNLTFIHRIVCIDIGRT